MRPNKPIDTQGHILTGMVMPQALELEEAVLGAIITDGRCMAIVSDFLRSTDFYLNANQIIYSALANLYQSGNPIDLLTVNDEVNRMGKLEEVGGVMYLIDLSNKVTSSANVEFHAKLIQDKSILREVIKVSSDGLKTAFSGEIMATELIADITNQLEASNRVIKRPETIAEIYAQILEEGEIEGLKTGFKKLDEITNGLWGYVVLAAGPGEGKSVFSLNIARNVSMSGIPVVLFSLEMKKNEIIFRLMSDELNMAVRDIMANKYDPNKALRSYIPELPLHIFDNGSLTVEDMAGICKGLFKGKKQGLVIIDYLQLLTASNGGKKFGTRENEVAYISRKIKQLQMDLDIPVLALSQLSRDKNRKFYQLSDLRESGAIEQDANGVIFIYRPDTHNQTSYTLDGCEINTDKSDAIVSIGKWRLGDTGDFRMKFKGQYSRFEDFIESQTDYLKPMPELDNQIIGVRPDLNNIPF
ncbi:MAG TPA: replicative DNA helicase [Saprospiraceae bacterium]|nr:replicative DNA helicase [Saprospiraceae bacterium]